MFAEAEADPSLSKEAFKPIEARLRVALLNAQYQRLQKAEKSLLVVVAGIDGAGKGATVNLLNEWMDPRHIKTLAYGPPEGEELERPWLWRYWKDLPAKGSTGIVFGSWYAQLLRETSRKRPNQDTIEALSAAIRRFEAMLTAEGVQIVKLWFHLSADAQRRAPSASEQPRDLVASRPRRPEGLQEVQPSAQRRPDRHQSHRLRPRALGGDPQRRRADARRAHRRGRAGRHAPAQRAAHPARLRGAFGACAHRRPARPARLRGPHRPRGLRVRTRPAAGPAGRAARSKKFQDRSLVLVFEGQDAAGKGGAIRRVTHALDARQFDITPVAAPNSYELSRPYLWRFWRQLPRRGRIAIFDRSWYGRVLVERVEKLAAPDWRRAYAEINDFEEQLSGSGALVLKFWLAVTPDVQLERFKEREKSPFKNFKITPDDWRNRDKWKEYAAATNEMLTRTDVAHAPWHLVSANDKRYARLQVLRHIVEALENPR